jgi:hypothetical protein
MSNWSNADERRNIIFRAVGRADNKISYVFVHFNLDSSLRPVCSEKKKTAE